MFALLRHLPGHTQARVVKVLDTYGQAEVAMFLLEDGHTWIREFPIEKIEKYKEGVILGMKELGEN